MRQVSTNADDSKKQEVLSAIKRDIIHQVEGIKRVQVIDEQMGFALKIDFEDNTYILVSIM